MKYCTSCGNAIAENDLRLCDACASKAEQAVALTTKEAEAVESSNYSAAALVELAKQYLLQPERSLAQTYRFANAWPGAVFAIGSSIVLSLICLLYLKRVLSAISAMMGGFMGMFMGRSAMMGEDVPYAEIFIKMTLGFAVQWLLLALLVVGVAKLFKLQVSVVQAINGIGVSKLYLAAGAVIMLVLGFLHALLGAGVFVGSWVMAYLAADRALKPLLAKQSMYVLPLSVTLYVIVEVILIRAFVS